MGSLASAVLLMAYGTPERLEDVGDYFTHIRGGRRPSDEAVEHLRERYERVGGGTPLLDITRRVAERLRDAFAAEGEARPVYMGMKHWHPYISDVVRRMAADGVERVTAIALAPHYSRMSIGGYRKALEEANAALARPMELRVVERWGMHPAFLDMMAGLVRAGLEQFPAAERASVLTVFSAHSLPERIREWGDPYERELHESSAAVAERVGLPAWRFAWQSAGGTGEPWIGPDILDYLETLHGEGVRSVLQVPIGFVSDHLEVLYDIDLEAKQKAAELGMTLHRTALPNDSAPLIETLAAVAREAEAGVGV
ncbi:MAG TPA: ferrochelatase [Gemmatimonadaceae bacterium]|nr:ferrochelatase [Gemmatimonadaceae bacterium]